MTSDPSPAAAMHAGAAAALDRAGVAWVRLREAHGPEDDLLVAPEDIDPATVALASVGFALVRHLGHGSHREFHAVDGTSGAWAKIDVVTRIDLGPHQEVRTALAAGFLARRSVGATLAPDDAFWALLLHELWDRPTPSIRQPEALAAAARPTRSDALPPDAVRPILPAGVGPASVIKMAAAGDTDGLVQLGRRMRSRRGVSVRARRVVARVLRRIDRSDPPFVRRGLSIAVMGPDGTGKSSLATGLADRGTPLPVRSVYLGLYGGGRRGRGGRVPGLGLVMRLTRMWRGWMVGRVHVARGRLVILDRHPYDARLPVAGKGPSLGRRLTARALPSPDLVVILDAPPEVLHARKPEHSVERSADQRAAYRVLSTLIAGAALVDADRPADMVARDVLAMAWGRLARRAGPR